MTAARFRSVIWVAVAAGPALGCYLVTQSVAQDRAELAKVERQIRISRTEIRDLETELGARASMAQVERWNNETLALAAPRADQFLASDVQLASLGEPPAAAAAPTRIAPAVAQVAYDKPAAAAPIVEESQPALRRATYIKPARDAAGAAPQKVAMLSDGPLGDDVLADIGRIASTERGRAGRGKQ